MTTRRKFMQIAGAGALVGTGALGINKLGDDDGKENELYTRIEKALREENPDISPETVRAISADFSQISDLLKAGTASVSGLLGAIYNKLGMDGKTGDTIFTILPALLAYAFVADQAVEIKGLRKPDVLQKELQNKYGLTAVQAIHVEKTLREETKNHFNFLYGAVPSVAGTFAHKYLRYFEKNWDKPDNDGVTPFQ